MEIEIKGNNVELKFDFRFIRKMDTLYRVEQDGLGMSVGVAMAFNGLAMYSVTDLVNVIHGSIVDKVSRKDVEGAVEEYAEENDGLEGLFIELREELGKSPLTKATVQQFKKLAQA